jgi:asparagine synthetase B (glutamine-hydrolysing)
MAHAVLVCPRDPRQLPAFERALGHLAERLQPDESTAAPPMIRSHAGVVIAIYQRADAVSLDGGAACIGQIVDEAGTWSTVGGTPPDGAYALFRSDPASVELASDAVASRTIWYCEAEGAFIAATSQRALVFLLGNFDFNPGGMAWMLSSGALGPGQSWDRRIEALGPGARLILDRMKWELRVTPGDYAPELAELSPAAHRERLLGAIEETMRRLAVDPQLWNLALSGGRDSRALLVLWAAKHGVGCVTWCDSSALSDPASDAAVARSLADRYGVALEFHDVGKSPETLRDVLSRFVKLTEGRVDHVTGYLDGFAAWRRMANAGRLGIVRGDEAFGSWPVVNESHARRTMGMRLLSDHRNGDEVAKLLPDDAREQRVPPRLRQQPTESLVFFRDRLKAQYRLPTVLAALNAAKSHFLEVVNPFVCGRILRVVRALPDELRTEKLLFRNLVSDLGSEVRFSSTSAIADRTEFTTRSSLVDIVLDTLGSQAALERLGRPLATYLSTDLERRIEGTYAPVKGERVASKTSRSPKRSLKRNTAAFRAFVIVRAVRVFEADAAAGAMIRRA